jgi:hypothetical protein
VKGHRNRCPSARRKFHGGIDTGKHNGREVWGEGRFSFRIFQFNSGRWEDETAQTESVLSETFERNMYPFLVRRTILNGTLSIFKALLIIDIFVRNN